MSYYGQPVLKEPTWTWEIPLYFFTGGVAGASAGLAYLADDEALARRAWAVALGGVAVSPALLVSDLGKPSRFLNMLRMFKVTSPMSVGSWILSASGAAISLAAVNAWTGLFPRGAAVARPAAALLGLPLSTYTAALVANTAVPVWHEARLGLPFVFAGGAAASAGGLVAAVTPEKRSAPARRLAVGGAVAEIVSAELMKHRLGKLGEPYEHGAPGRLRHAAQALIAGGLVTMRRAPRVAGALLAAGTLAERWSVYRAGFASAADPKYVVEPQRARIERGETRGAARSTSHA